MKTLHIKDYKHLFVGDDATLALSEALRDAKVSGAEVLSLDLSAKPRRIVTTDGEILAHTVVIAMGAYPRVLGVEGEERFLGRGVHTCAHCDGRFYKGKTVLVVGGGNSALEDALYLSRLSERVILVHRRDTFRAENYLVNALKHQDNIEILYHTVVEEFLGDDRFLGVRVSNVNTDVRQDLTIDGVFVSVGRVPATGFLPKEIARNTAGYILADESTRTSVEGVYAIGDVRTKPLRQIVTAVADGATAVEEIKAYLARNEAE